jgi:hypothetical protein
VGCSGWVDGTVRAKEDADRGRRRGVANSMRNEFVRTIAGLVVAGAVVCLSAPVWGQDASSRDGAIMQGPSGSRLGGFGEGPDADQSFAEKRLRALNEDRHKSMVSDAAKLVKLARQLDAEVASNPTNELTPEELHQVAEIEKLARNVKAKMVQSFGGGPQYRPMPFPIPGAGVH